MNSNDYEIRRLTNFSLLFFLATVAVYLWFMDIMKTQRTFGMLISSELMAFSLLIYTSSISMMNRTSKIWLLMGCFTLVILLSLTLIVP